ncbi:MAG: DUF393 domain-containing protein [Pseudomonadota bacterium]
MTKQTDVIYNAECPICSREIELYRAEAEAANLPISFTPINRADLAAHDLDPDAAARRLHVLQDGTLLSGTDAFLAMWRALPRWRWLARVVSVPGLRHLATFIYETVLAPLLYGMHRRRMARRARS